jgi:hypothetical protein
MTASYASARRLAWLIVGGALLIGCDPRSGGSPSADAGASPNASILPAPLATGTPDFDAGLTDASAQRLTAIASSDAAVSTPPELLRTDVAMPADPPAAREQVGVGLHAVFRWSDVPLPPKAPAVSAEGIKAAQKLTAPSWNVELSEAGRMRIVFASRALPLPERTELRARSDRYGSIVVWPNSTDYRIVAPGTLRTILGERRVDVTPLSSIAPITVGSGRRLGMTTRKIEFSSPLGKLSLELAKVAEAGEGGPLFCRALGELVGLAPQVAACKAGEVPLWASYDWPGGGELAIEVTALTRRADLSPTDLVVPPSGAAFTDSGLPIAPAGIFLTRDELARFRSTGEEAAAPIDPRAPGEGFVAVNPSDILQYLLVDGVPVVAVPAANETYVIGTLRGRYVLQWRTFLGDAVSPATTADLPARVTFGGAPDAGAQTPAASSE